MRLRILCLHHCPLCNRICDEYIFNGLYDAYFHLICYDFKGQVWRLVTFILQPPSNSIIFVVFVLYFYYLIGSVLERIWGSFRFNVYFFTGVILNILASLIIYLIWGLSFKLSTNYINLALFMAFAMEQPDMEVYYSSLSQSRLNGWQYLML